MPFDPLPTSCSCQLCRLRMRSGSAEFRFWFVSEWNMPPFPLKLGRREALGLV